MIESVACLGADLAAGHRRVEVVSSRAPSMRLAKPFVATGEIELMSTTVLPGLSPSATPSLANKTPLDVRRVRHHEDDDVGVLGDLFGRRCSLRACGELRRDRELIVEMEFVAGVDEMARHGPAHDAEPDESNFRHLLFLLRPPARRERASQARPASWSSACIRSRSSRRSRARRAGGTGSRS